MDFRPIFYVIGVFLCILATCMLLPMLADLYTGSSDWRVFFFCGIITAFFGGALVLSNSGQNFNLSIRQAFLLTSLSWIIMCAFGALPFYMSELDMNFADSFFESMSGITTTGSTVIVGLDNAPKGILLWRGLLQMLGGIGFIVMAISLLPMLRVGGMRLFRTESSEREKALPRAAQLANSIAVIYIGLTVLCMICFMLTGMGVFDASVHAMAALATGGFSNYDASFGQFTNPFTHIIAIIFMLLGGMPFVLYIKAIRGDIRPLFQDTQVRWFLAVILACTLALSAYMVIYQGKSPFDSILSAAFNIVSIGTTTGFASEDYTKWGFFPISVFFFLTFLGACSGSTSGGIKIFRFQILFEAVNVQFKKLLHPHGVFIPHYNEKPIPKDVPLSVMGFFFVYIFVFAAATMALCFLNLDLITAASSVVACMGNVGPGLGDIVGPAGHFKPLPDAAKWILSLCMLLGRLELFTLLVLLSPHFWMR